MADDNNNTDANAASSSSEGAADNQENKGSSTEQMADKMFDADSGENKADDSEGKTDDDSKDNKDNDAKDKSENDSSDAKDEADEGEESEEGDGDDKKDDAYADVVLPQDLPEGMEIDTELLTQAKEIAAKHKLPPEALKEMVDLYAGKQIEGFKAQPQKLQDEWAEIETGWKKEAKADKEIGGDQFQAKTDLAIKAVDKFGTDGFKAVLDQFRLGNNPDFIKVFSRIGEAISEDGSFSTGSNAGARTQADILFDNTKT